MNLEKNTIQKQCSKFNLTKSIAHYYKDGQKKDGYNSYCKSCVKERNRPKRERNGFYQVVRNPIQ